MEPNPSDSDTMMDFEIVLNKELGQIGRYQIFTIAMMFFPAMFSGFMAGDYVFTAGKLPHRCYIPNCDNDTKPQFTTHWIPNAIPLTATGYSECSRYENITELTYQPVVDACPSNLFNTTNVIPCERYVYERTNSVVYDFHLECKEWLRALAGTLNSMGALIALPLAGFVSDQFGRRVSIVFFGFNVALVGVLKSFSVNYEMYVTLQFLHTAIGGGMFSAAYILVTEIVGARYRVRTSATMSMMFAMGQALLGVFASFIMDWRKLTLRIFAPCFGIITYYFIINESHRWLLSKNKTVKAKAALRNAARMNGTKISDKTMNYLLNVIPKIDSKNRVVGEEQNLIVRVLRSPTMLRRCCTTPVMWIATTLIYYGLSINSVALSGNIYVNYIVTALVEIPGFWTAVLLLDRVGRKITLFGGYTVCGVCCLAFAFIPNNTYYLSLFLYLMGKYCTGLVFTSLYLFTSELYPTRHRHSFLGFSSMMGRIGSIVAPLTPPLMDYWAGIPSVLFGVMAIVSGLLVLTLPETLGHKVPDTFEEAEDLGK